MAFINPDLQKERDGASFDVLKLNEFLHGGKDQVVVRRKMAQNAINDLKSLDLPVFAFLSREEKYNASMKKSAFYIKRHREGYFKDDMEELWYRNEFFANESPPFALQFAMFIPTIRNQTTEKQKEMWLDDAENFRMLGTYAQTELGHGTHVRGLETTATYDPDTEEFVMHSPTLTSIKWWPGSLGKTTNHCVVMATLVTKGRKEGVHPFMVQTRSMETHEPLPGITIGDIGPKLGYETIDNGFLKFDHVRIPRHSMLAKYAKIEKDGTFVREAKNSKLNYGVMVYVRTGIVLGVAARGLAQACTIAIRYSCVRRQSELKPGGTEPQVLDFQTQQQKLFPWLAASYAYWFSGFRLLTWYQTVTAEIESGNVDTLPELHALSSGLKAYSTNGANLGMEACRLSCGGHGYSQSSGFPSIYSHATPGATYEGENTVLYLQTARYLLKSFTAAQSGGKLSGIVRFISEKLPAHSSLCSQIKQDCVITAIKFRALKLGQKAAQRMMKLTSSGKESYDAWNLSSVYWVQAAEALIELFVVETYAQAVSMISDPATQRVVNEVFQLFACDILLKNGKDYLMDNFMSQHQLDLVSEKLLSLLGALRPNAVALVDAFDFTDNHLGSILGRYDGNVYENLYKWAKASPLNRTEVTEAYHKYLRPVIHAEKSKL